MRIVLVAIGLSLFTGACVSKPTSTAHADLLIRDITIVSPERQSPSEPSSVLVRDGRIVEISDQSLPKESAETVIDGRGLYLSPGYIDAHVHLSTIPGMRIDQERAKPEVSAQARSQLPRSYLYHGFTTLIDLSSDSDLPRRWNDIQVGPTVHYCGALTIQDGYPTAHVPKQMRYEIVPDFIYDPERPDEFPAGYDRATQSPKSLVAQIADSDATCVKSYYEAGFGGKNLWPTPSEEILRQIKHEADKHSLPLMLHANSEMAQSIGVVIGADAFVHGMFSWNSDLTKITDSVRDVLDGVIAQEIGWQPTIQVLYGERNLHDPDYLTHPELKHVAPRILIDWYASEEGQWYRKKMAELPYFREDLETGNWEDINREGIERVNAAFTYLDEHGGNLMFGSDTPSDMTYANPPGLNGWREMERWLENGVSPAKLFRAVTLDNAVFFGLDEEIGTVEIGKRADLLILRGNPLENGHALNMIDVVVVKGRAIERQSLSAINK